MSCSREKNTTLSRAYHNVTSHYNGYFNARELMKEKESNMREGFEDDYSQLIPIFIYPTEEQSQAMYPDMDLVIEKCSEVIERHSIYKKKEEHVKWIDDSYFLIGKARLYKEEFGLAEQTFLYVYQSYKKDPARYQGLNWLIKTFIETKQWDRAEKFLDIADEKIKKIPEEFLGHFYAIYADYHIKLDKDYDKAIENLEKALEYKNKKDDQRRYTYVLAQLYQKKNQLRLATEYFSQVIKLNPEYTMRFNARISRAIAYDAEGNDSKAIKKELNKMLKDIKNEDFKDQIYYALAEISLKENNEPSALNLLQKSINSSVKNNKQKGLSYLRMADLYFEQPDYINAQDKYDSTLQFLPEEHPEYYPAEEKNNNLQELVINLKVINLQDSLLALSNLTDKEREKKIKKLVKKLKDADQSKKLAELRKLEAAQNTGNSGLINVAGNGRNRGQWYFYNPTNIALGVTDFKVIWGDRNLEDNWRRKNKLRQQIAQKLNQTEDSSTVKVKTVSDEEKYDPEFYLKGIPSGIEEQLVAHGKVAEALFNVGSLFKESFNDDPSAIKSFKRVTSQYDTSKYNLPSHYQLYRIYKANGVDEKAEIERNWVLENHPFSEYAYLIKNPNYAKESKATKEKVEEFYAATYKLYKYGLYKDVISGCEKADKSFAKNHLKAKFDLLKAKSIGFIKPKEEFKTALEKVVADHPKTAEMQVAKDILNYMNKLGSASNKTTASQNKATKADYNFNEDSKHILIISAFKKKGSKFPLIRNKISNFNKQFFRESTISVTQSALNTKSLYLVRTFENQQVANRYLKALNNNTEILLLFKEAEATPYLISNENFRILFQIKNEAEYLEFYNSEYPI